MSYTQKMYNTLGIRAAFVEGATSGEFPMNRIKAEQIAKEKYPMDAPKMGELAEIAEARRVPVTTFAPRNNVGEDKAF